MNSNTSYPSQKFKAICSGKGCQRRPKKLLRIKYVKKVGKFCQTCAADLLKAGLVEEDLFSENNREEGH